MADDLEKRVGDLEEGPSNTDIVITVQHERTVLDEATGERRRIAVEPAGFEEGDWNDAGRGNRMRLRTPMYGGAGHPADS